MRAAAIIGLIIATHPLIAQPNEKLEKGRTAWQYATPKGKAAFRHFAGKYWLELNPDGSRRFSFKETSRTGDYVELYDSSRGMWLRLRNQHGEWKPNNAKAWNRWVNGRWVAANKLPPLRTRPLDDYRIRLVYFVPKDRKQTENYEQKIRTVMGIVTELYAQNMQLQNLKSNGLRYETRQGKPVVHLVRSKRPAAFFNGAPKYDTVKHFQKIVAEIPREVGVPSKHVIIVFAETYDFGPARIEWPGTIARGGRFSTEGGVGIFSSWVLRNELCAASVTAQRKLLFDQTPLKGRVAHGHGRMNSPRFEFMEDGIGAVAHELGHALGLPHDHRQDQRYIMGNGFRNLRWNFAVKPKLAAIFSPENSLLLYASRYLGPDLSTADHFPPEVKLTLPAFVNTQTKSLEIRVECADESGLRCAVFFAAHQDSVVGGRKLNGKKQSFTQRLQIRPPKKGIVNIEAFVADIGGNLTRVTASCKVR